MPDKKQERQQELLNIMKQYVEGDTFDMPSFHKKQGSAYGRLTYNFGSVRKAIAALEEELGISLYIKENAPSDLSIASLRNKLAYDMMMELRKAYSLEEIADYYNTSRQLVYQLEQALKKTMEGK